MLNQKLRIYASRYLEGNNTTCPTGNILPVVNTPMDFTAGKTIGKEIDTGFSQTTMVGGGYDHCYVIDRARGSSQSICAWATSDKTGISMKLYTTQPGIQLYTGNFLQDCPAPGKGGEPMRKYGGFAWRPSTIRAAPPTRSSPPRCCGQARCSAPPPPCGSSPASSAESFKNDTPCKNVCFGRRFLRGGRLRLREFPSPFLCFAQTAHSLHVKSAKNLCQSKVRCIKMQQKYI